MRICGALLLFLFGIFQSQAQNYKWIRTIEIPSGYDFKGIVSDESGHVYWYANAAGSQGSGQTGGSILSVYDLNGSLLLKKLWTEPFYINKLVYDHNSKKIFAAGFYCGPMQPDNISLSGSGAADAFIGELSANGKFSWINSFSGSGFDHANDINISKTDGTLLVTGGCDRDIRYQQQIISSGEQRMFIASVQTNGSLNFFYTYDPYTTSPDIAGTNFGHHINSDTEGNLYVFSSLEGRPWSDFTNPKNKFGEYVLKFSPAGTVTWSTYIISSECYYGHSFGDLETDADGKIYLRKRCDQKYGGEGSILTIHPSNGTIINESGVQQSEYRCLKSHNNLLYIAGNEEAYGCPCPDNNFGKEVIKKVSFDGSVMYRNIFHKGYAYHITPASGNNVVVSGRFQNDSVSIGGLTETCQQGTYPYFLLLYEEPGTTGFSDEKSPEILLSPNPVDKVLKVTSKQAFDRFEITDPKGSSIMKGEIRSSETTIKTGGLTEGYYILLLYKSGELLRREKILVIH